ncbi:TraB/GumN family protein [Devosia sp.]|uniref:TraB/GumN family protein n=1 Tax=Devosia sp. TaxID=1871048 RepID=UPI0035AF0555
MRSRLRGFALATCLVLGASLPAAAEPAMWRVSDDDSHVWLFGSIHLFSRQMNWRTQTFDAALQDSEQVWFEMVFDAAAYATIARLTILDGRLRGGQRLSELLTEDQNERLDRAIAAAGLDPLIFDRLQPWMAEVTLSSGSVQGTTAGVDILIDAEVSPDKKRGFETAEEQLGFFSRVPLDQQIEGLMATIDALQAGGVERQLARMTDAWESGDTEALDALIRQEMGPADGVRYRRLLTDRNVRWVATIEDVLAEDVDSMVIVGTGHLVGPDGLPALLGQRGFTVERIGQVPANPGGPAVASPTPRRR